MVEQFCSECGKMLAEHEGLRCDACRKALKMEGWLREILEAMKQKAIDNFRESLVEAVKKEFKELSEAGTFGSGIVEKFVNVIRTHKEE